MKISDTSDLWWKTAVVYCLDVETFLDLDGDGVGDLPGLVNRIDYLADLGVTCLWLMPFYPDARSRRRCSITDFYGVDSRLGSHGDLVELIRTARDRGSSHRRSVVNHTSDRHPWFKAARSSKNSPYRDYYVWRSDRPPDTSKWSSPIRSRASGNTTRSPANTSAPLLQVPARPQRRQPTGSGRDRQGHRLWLELGLSGFRRCGAVSAGDDRCVRARAGEFADPHEYLRSLRAFIGRRSGRRSCWAR